MVWKFYFKKNCQTIIFLIPKNADFLWNMEKPHVLYIQEKIIHMSAHIKLGKQGEDIAATHLTEKAYRILERNWRYKRAELDLIAMDGETLVFIEVKTRSYVYLAEPEESVNYRKQDLLVSAAAAYMREHDHDWAYRFDIISIVKDTDQRFQIKHLVDAFEPRVM